MAQFIGLYRGRTVSEAELVAVCSDERIVKKFVEELAKPESRADSSETAPELRERRAACTTTHPYRRRNM